LASRDRNAPSHITAAIGNTFADIGLPPLHAASLYLRAKVDKFSSDALVEMLARASVSVQVTVRRARRVA
jgi:hypothetical protein